MLTASPRLISWHVKQTWTRLISRRAASKLQAGGFDVPSGAVDFTCPRQVVESKAEDAFTPLQKGALRTVVCDAILSKDKHIKEGYDVDPLCELCKKQPDSMFHRLWECDCENVVEAKSKHCAATPGQ